MYVLILEDNQDKLDVLLPQLMSKYTVETDVIRTTNNVADALEIIKEHQLEVWDLYLDNEVVGRQTGFNFLEIVIWQIRIHKVYPITMNFRIADNMAGLCKVYGVLCEQWSYHA